MSEDNKALVRRVYDEIFGQGDLDLTEELFSQDFELHDGLGSDVTGPEAVKQVATMLRSAFPDFQTHVEDLLTDGNKVAGRWNWTGTHKGEIRRTFFRFRQTITVQVLLRLVATLAQRLRPEYF